MTTMYEHLTFVIHSGMSECNQKQKARIAEPGIRTDRSRQTVQSPWLDGYG
jgi:hypothetical protein